MQREENSELDGCMAFGGYEQGVYDIPFPNVSVTETILFYFTV